MLELLLDVDCTVEFVDHVLITTYLYGLKTGHYVLQVRAENADDRAQSTRRIADEVVA